MNYDFFISSLDDHNQESILLSEKIKPKEVIYICENEEKSINRLEALKEFYKEKFPKIIFNSIIIKNINLKEIIGELEKYLKKKCIVNLSASDKILNIILMHICEVYNLEGICLDIEKGRVLEVINGQIFMNKHSDMDLDIDEIIESFGGSILVESTDIDNSEVIRKISHTIANNLDKWESLKYRLYDKRIFMVDEIDSRIMRINLEFLTNEEKSICTSTLKFLREYEQLSYSEKSENITVEFKNDYIRSFIFKSGSWLEAYVKDVISEIKQIDEVKSGVVFLWNDERARIKNEIDVMAIKDSTLICISCKDSAKYDDVALNELNVYSEKVGGDNIKKILVATKEPLKTSMFSRAKEMDINIVIFDGNREKFKKSLEAVVKGELVHL
ncbi:DUF1887 family CARF protein [Clostridium sp. YIM B02506]|uniref:Card1-like endonuclease domain-containing protein n=1 Tax=Clostridium sp. YIM B02506 TaxID=2910680 RepID=UPI001EED1F3E|nr:DUF1887 family CARF protein [Clostridium sp. YIM B02506]